MAASSLGSRLLGLAQACHPFPLAVVVALTALLGFVSADGGPDGSRLGLAVLAMFCSQLAIGWLNDYRDRDTDREFQPWKPVPSGLVPAEWLPWSSLAALAVSFLAGIALGPAPLALLAVGTAAGLTYDLGLKDTRLSPLPFLLAFGVLPPFVWTALDAFRDDFLWLYAVASPLALAGHIANVLPDLDADTAAGRRSIAVVLGRSRSLWLLAASLAAPPALVAATSLFAGYDAVWLGATLLVYAALIAGAAAGYGRIAGRGGDVFAFRCVVVAAVLFAVGWLAAA